MTARRGIGGEIVPETPIEDLFTLPMVLPDRRHHLPVFVLQMGLPFFIKPAPIGFDGLFQGPVEVEV